MRAVLIRKPGGYTHLEIVTLPTPQRPEPHEVCIEVTHCGVNYADILVRLGLYKSAKDHGGYPLVPGFDFAGIVKNIGSAVQNVIEGQRVFGATLFGAYQSEIVIDSAYVVPIPQSLTNAQAASLPTAFFTAHYALTHTAHIKQGEKVLVHSLAGGVGSWLGILGRRAGGHIYGTTSTNEKREYLLGQGFSNVQRETADFRSETFDIILNAKGGMSVRRDLEKLNPMGRLIVYGAHGMIRTSDHGRLSLFSWLRIILGLMQTPLVYPLHLVNKNRTVSGFNLSYLHSQKQLYKDTMSTLITIIEEGVEIPPVKEIPFDEVAHAHHLMERGQTVGKVVLRMQNADLSSDISLF